MIKGSEVKEIPKIYSEDLRKLVMKMLTRDQNKRPSTTQLLKDPVLVDLMIKNSSSVSLKQAYSKDLEKPVTLSESFINNQTNMVHLQLKKFEK
jgi:serine/threonine protein kinase